MESTPSQLPESYDFSQSQFTQTQPQTQPDTQPQSSSTAFPSHLWGILLSSSGEASSTTANATNSNGGGDTLDRPTRYELIRPSFGGKATYTIGRHPKNDLRLNSPKVSNNHARITLSERDGLVKLEDLSTNGTFVRGIKIGKNRVTILEPGDSIIFGPASVDFGNDFRYVFQCPPSNSSHSDPYGLGELSQSGSKVFSRYEVREQIGKGSFASVRKGVRRSDGTMVAIKIIQKARFANNPKTLEMFSREITIIQQLDHPFCVKCYDWFEDDARIWIVLEYVDGGDLLDYTMKKKGLSERETREIALMVCQAVAYLHSCGITHRDLKPENLLLTKSNKPVCKVTDFGLAKMVTDQTMLKTMCGTPTYLAPEVILNPNPQAGYSPAVDAWSIGVVLFSLLTCQTPFDESESTPLPQRMRERRVDFDFLIGEGLSELCVDFLRKLLVADPRKRMSCVDAIEHPWLRTIRTNANAQHTVETMSASDLLNQHFGASSNANSNDSSPVGSTSKPLVAGLASAISLDQSPRPHANGFEGDAKDSDDSLIDSQAIGNLRLSHVSSSNLAADSVAQMPPPPPLYKSPRQPIVPLTTPPAAPAASLAPPPSKGTKRKEPESAFSDSSLSDLSTSQNASQREQDGEEAEEDSSMRDGSGMDDRGGTRQDEREDSPEAPPSINGNGSLEDGDKMERGEKKGREYGAVVGGGEDSVPEEPSTTEESMEKESSPLDSVSSVAGDDDDDEAAEEDDEVATPARRRSTRSRTSTSTSTSTSTAATVRGSTPASGRKPRSARASAGGGSARSNRRKVTPQIEEDDEVEAEVGGIAASVKNRRRKAARLN
ncbi:hypothetical protein JCM11491_005861 [Sporobolomyces phaffii]